MSILKNDHSRIVFLYNSGMGLRDLAYEYSVSKCYVRKVLKCNGVHVISRDHCKCSNGDIERIVELYRSGYSLQMISVLMNINYKSVRSLLISRRIGRVNRLENCVE